MLLLAATHQVFASGNNQYQKLGMNLDAGQVSTFTKSNFEFDSIDLGGAHGLGISKSGELYCWGKNTEYQCTDLGTDKIAVPTEIRYFKDNNIQIKVVDGGEAHSAAIDTNGNVYVWGSNSYGQLGLGEGVQEAKVPTQIDQSFFDNERAAFVTCQAHITYVRTESGKLFVFGLCTRYLCENSGENQK